MKNKTLLLAYTFIAIILIACSENEEPMYVGERIALIVAASDNPAKDGTPSLQDLMDAGVQEVIGTQVDYEEAIATADSIPTTLTELQDIIFKVNEDLLDNDGNFETLAWSDEFNDDGQPSSQRWNYDIGTGDWGWGNGEQQYYTQRTDNVTISGGTLKIKAKKESYSGSAYTSARLKTQGKYSFTYGKVEVRAKLPKGGGTWPAIWMLGNNISSVGWPACGEIDIMEHKGNEVGDVSSAIHNTSGYGATPYFNEQFIADVTDDFHVYGIVWTSKKIDFMVDGTVHYTYEPAVKNDENWPFNDRQFLILNVAMGGTLGGNIASNFTEGTMEIDYVRVYQ
jgi:beta-glucanase (GH16 family)